MTKFGAATMTDYNEILTNDDMFPGMVIRQTYVDYPIRSGVSYVGVVTDIRCPDDCGYMVAYVGKMNGSTLSQCSASMTGNPKVCEVRRDYV